MKTSVTISMVPSLSKGPWIFWEDLPTSIAKAASLGFDAVEMFSPKPEAIDSVAFARLLEQNDIAVSAFGSGAGKAVHGLHLVHQDESVRTQARDFIARMIDLANQFGAPVIIGSMQGSVPPGVNREQAFDWLREALNNLGERARPGGAKLIIEPLNRYETDVLNTLAQGVELIKSLTTDNVDLLADCFHMNIEEQSIPDALRAAAGHIGLVHLADSNRRPAGLGHTDFAAIIAALKDIGYTGYISAEALPYPTPDAAAAQTIAACRALGI